MCQQHTDFITVMQFMTKQANFLGCSLGSSLQFASDHWEIGELSGRAKAPLVLAYAALDILLLVATVALLALKGKLSANQYLSDSRNKLFGSVLAFSVICSCVYGLLAYSATVPDDATPDTFERAMLVAMASYPLGPEKRLVDRIQMKYSCCGATDPTEWFSIDWYGRKSNWTQDDVPFSCCSAALQIPCVHLNMRRHTYYIKYNSSAPTIWTEGCTTKFKDVYLLEFDWLVYFGALVSALTIVLALLDKLVQTADNTFALNGTFQLGIFSSEPQWDRLFDCRNRRMGRNCAVSKVRSPRLKAVLSNMSEVARTFGKKCKKQRRSGSPGTASSSVSPCKREIPRCGSQSGSLRTTICEDTSASSESSARKRKLAYFLPSSCIKRKKEN